jgi:hypothetical protein
MDSLFAAHPEEVPAEDLLKIGIARAELLSLHSIWRPETPHRRNLGCAILLAAIEDYQGLDPQAHEHAKQFLFPQTQEWRDHQEWVVSLAGDMTAARLQQALERSKGVWDERRCALLEEQDPQCNAHK